ncbi:Gp49 family protein [Methylobacterium radiotolerans]|uniref:Gp49 family protein n=1 Tax=Methylobacterium radiotolerans TaxID=31998 RepID=UPI000D5D21D3|nr:MULTISPECIES: Gp49 family protein [Methylobacterium]MDE3749427.1 Gp49 family protein [Methylobacterium radiotolerans]PVY97900.1 N4 Gp49/Sf6 Gp66 family protein [Methylobacterium organophilum]
MPQYTKKPVTIEARQFETNNDDGSHMSLLCDWANGSGDKVVVTHDGTSIYVATLEGTMRAEVGDWIIRGVKGELYPCKPDIFAASYMPASREADATGKPAITRAEADAGLSAAPAPRVTLESLEAKVASAEYFRSKTLTICILTLANGFTIVGKSACASPENYSQALGERYAYDDAFRQIWAFEGYLLRERLAAA